MTYTNAGQLNEITTLWESTEQVYPERVVVTCDTCGALLLASATQLHDVMHPTIVEPIEIEPSEEPDPTDQTSDATIGTEK